jgi:acetyl esterase/lipase
VKDLNLILFFLALVFISCEYRNTHDNKSFKPVYYSSNYVTDWDVEYGSEGRQKMDIYLRGQQYVDKDHHNVRLKGKQPPTIIYSHGSAWYFSDKRKHEHKISPFLQMGYNVVNLNYSIKQGVSKATKDVRLALLYLLKNNEKFNLDLENVFLAGVSAGAHMSAFWGAAQNSERAELHFSDSIKIKGVINLMGGGAQCADIYNVLKEHENQWWRDVGASLVDDPTKADSILEAWCPVNYLDQEDPPMFIAIGEKDQFGSQEKLNALTSALSENDIPYDLAKYPNSGHDFLTEDYNDLFQRISIFIEKYKK